jgi:hypothetical protein
VSQTRLESFIEVCLNTFIGFCVSYSAGPLMYLYLNIPYSSHSNLVITGGFTVLSIARSYVVRRWCHRWLHQVTHSIATGFLKLQRKILDGYRY